MVKYRKSHHSHEKVKTPYQLFKEERERERERQRDRERQREREREREH